MSVDEESRAVLWRPSGSSLGKLQDSKVLGLGTTDTGSSADPGGGVTLGE